jgi:hypothetical protein
MYRVAISFQQVTREVVAAGLRLGGGSELRVQQDRTSEKCSTGMLFEPLRAAIINPQRTDLPVTRYVHDTQHVGPRLQSRRIEPDRDPPCAQKRTFVSALSMSASSTADAIRRLF